MHRPILTAGALLFASCAGPESPHSFQVERRSGRVEIREEDRPVLSYQQAPVAWQADRERAHYLHPLRDLDGAILTENSPADHPHQHGVYWSWHQVWLGEQRLGDAWEDREFHWDVIDVSAGRDGPAQVLHTTVEWKSPHHTNGLGAMVPVVQEVTTITIHPAEGSRRCLDFEIRLQALVPDLRLGGSEDAKGYGGFSARLRLPEDVQFLASSGSVEPESLALALGPWVDVTAGYGDPGSPSGLTMLQHPSVPGFPQPWILRRAGSMQNPVYPGRGPVLLGTEEPTVLRYRLVVHRGRITVEQGNRWQAEYALAPGQH